MRLEVCLCKRFGDFRLDLSFDLAVERLGIFGPSASGKTSLIHMLAGLLRPDEGWIRLDGETFDDISRGIHLPAEQRRMAVVFQQPNLFPHLCVRDNLLFAWRRIPRAARRIDPDELIAALALESLLPRRVPQLSGGEMRRVELGRAVLSCPRLILLDEPLNGIDGRGKYAIIPYLNRVCRQFSIPHVLISHSLTEIRLLTDHVLEMEAGGVRGVVSTAELGLRHGDGRGGGFVNLLECRNPRVRDGLYIYDWQGIPLEISAGCQGPLGIFELPARDIVLFARRPEGAGARNLIPARVIQIHPGGEGHAVELGCGEGRLVAQITRDSLREMGLVSGSSVYALVKAGSFRRLFCPPDSLA